MKKAELEVKIIELEKKLAVLEARPVCYGHYCNHFCNLPHYPTQPYWGTISCGSSSGNITFGNIS